MPLRFALLLLALAATVPLTACSTTGDDDDDITPPDDDDDLTPSDDDDATPPPDPTLDVDPSALNAGEMVPVSVTINDLDTSQGVGLCQSSSPEILVWEVLNQSAAGFDLLMMPGIYADGTETWCLTNGQQQVAADFAVAPYATALAPLTLGTPEAIDLADDGAFAVYTLELAEDSTVYGRVATPGADLDPNLMVFADDGRTIVAAASAPDGDGGYTDDVFVAELDAGSYVVRAGQVDLLGGVDATGSIDLVAPVVPDAVDVAEVEPNDEDATDLGALGLGDWVITGTAATAGHDETSNDLNGDLDYFSFTLAEDAVITFELAWPDMGEDFDAILFDASVIGGVDGSFDSADGQLGFGLASTDQPETATALISAGEYALLVGNWEGNPDAGYTLSMNVRPLTWPVVE
jgi:hypothetical protein